MTYMILGFLQCFYILYTIAYEWWIKFADIFISQSIYCIVWLM